MAMTARVSGVGGLLATNVNAYLSSVEIPEGADPRQYELQVHDSVVDALRAYGYFSPDINISYSQRNHVRISIDKGKRTYIKNLDLQVQGQARQDDTVLQTVKKSPLAQDQGKPLVQEEYTTLKSQLDTLALQRGYFDAHYLANRIEIRPWEQRADIFLIWDSGPRYRFGAIHFKGSQIRQNRLRAMLPFKEGDPYSSDQIAEYNSRLGDSGWFRSVTVVPQLKAASSPQASSTPETSTEQAAKPKNTTAPVNVTVIPADRDQFDTGVGISSDIGPNLQFTWTRPWMNSRGDSWKNQLFLSRPRSKLGGQYRIPLAQPLHDEFDFNYGFQYINDNNTITRGIYFTPDRVWHFNNGWNQHLYVRFSKDDFNQAHQSGNVFLITPGISWDRTSVDNPQFPMHGNRQDFMIEGASSSLGSDISFIRSEFTTRWIESIGNNNRFYLRGNIAATATNQFSKMPPQLRFFAGGDDSVRGYGYQKISPRTSDNELLGGKDMITGTAEYQRRLFGNFWGAVFYDAGNAFDSWPVHKVYRAAGIGIRWVTLIGPIRINLAHAYDGHKGLHVSFAIGPEF